jgi:hypothetical protein
LFRGWSKGHFVVLALLVGVGIGAVGLATRDAGAALLGGVGGGILAWALQKGAIFYCLRGAALGAVFLTIAGPGADLIISRTSIGPNAVKAIVAGALVGGMLGVKNARPRKPVGAT